MHTWPDAPAHYEGQGACLLYERPMAGPVLSPLSRANNALHQACFWCRKLSIHSLSSCGSKQVWAQVSTRAIWTTSSAFATSALPMAWLGLGLGLGLG